LGWAERSRPVGPEGGVGRQAFGVGAVNPGLGGKEKAVPPRLISNSLEFEGIKIRVVKGFPNAEEPDGIRVCDPHSQPVGG